MPISVNPVVSVIVTSYSDKRFGYLKELLESIRTQTYPLTETIVVIETDRVLLRNIVAHMAETPMSNSRVLFHSRTSGASLAKNLGTGDAKGEILAMVDDDTVLAPDWIEQLVLTYEDDTVVGVTGPVLPLWEHDSMDWFPPELDWVFGCARWLGDKKRGVRSFNGPSCSLRKSAFHSAGGWNVSLGPRKGWGNRYGEAFALGEETDLSLRVTKRTGRRIVYNPKLVMFHRVSQEKFKIKYIVERSFQVGNTRRMLKERYGQGTSRFFATENFILSQIIIGLPRMLLRKPFNGWQCFSVISLVLIFLSLGYFGGRFVTKSGVLTGDLDLAASC